MAKKQTNVEPIPDLEPGPPITRPEVVEKPVQKPGQERRHPTGGGRTKAKDAEAEAKAEKLGYEEALICYDYRADRIERQDGTGPVAEVVADTFVSVLSDKTGLEFRPTKVMKRVGSWMNIREGRRKEFSHMVLNQDAGENIRHTFEGYPAFFFLWVRLYGEGDKAAILRNAVQDALDNWLIKRMRSIKREFCYFFGEPGVCELIACLTNSRDRATLSSMLERVRRTIPQSEEPTLPTVPAQAISLDELRSRMNEVVRRSGLSLKEIGVKMGFDTEKNPKANVWWLLNKSEDPGIFTLEKFCEAVQTSLMDLLYPTSEVSRQQ